VTDAMPAVFIGHGSPMNTLELNIHTEQWRRLGDAIRATYGRPSAILSVSAHWYINATAVTAMSRPRTIHDFYGFPPELFAVEYPAPGSPELAAAVVEAAAPVWVGVDNDSWGLDHGTWSVLAHVFPDADVPVVQLAIDAGKSYDEHLALGARLAPLREQGVLVLASGNVVHNLGRVDFSRPGFGFDWAYRFDDVVREQLLRDPSGLPAVAGDRDHGVAVPTPDHFIPVLYAAGVAAAGAGGADVMAFNIGCTLGSLSMTSYVVGDGALLN
jgi:4,5-DOPA dioxygenase extradiol